MRLTTSSTALRARSFAEGATPSSKSISEQSADDVRAFSKCLDDPGVYSTDLIGRAATFVDAADENHDFGRA
jgi:hypothetical protein